MSGRASRHVHAHVVAETAWVPPGLACSRRLCLGCGLRRPLFRYRQVVKADPDHTLCFQCYRALQQCLRARRLASLTSVIRNDVFAA